MKKILEASSCCLWEHDGRYCIRDTSLGQPPTSHCDRTKRDVIEWAFLYPGLPQYADIDAAILNYFDHDLVTMVMLEQL